VPLWPELIRRKSSQTRSLPVNVGTEPAENPGWFPPVGSAAMPQRGRRDASHAPGSPWLVLARHASWWQEGIDSAGATSRFCRRSLPPLHDIQHDRPAHARGRNRSAVAMPGTPTTTLRCHLTRSSGNCNVDLACVGRLGSQATHMGLGFLWIRWKWRNADG